jgi:hypothetical protein
LVELVEGDGVAECFELALEASGAVLDGVALALPIGSEIPIGRRLWRVGNSTNRDSPPFGEYADLRASSR